MANDLNDYNHNARGNAAFGLEDAAAPAIGIGRICGGVYLASGVTLDDGDFGRLQLNSSGHLIVVDTAAESYLSDIKDAVEGTESDVSDILSSVEGAEDSLTEIESAIDGTNNVLKAEMQFTYSYAAAAAADIVVKASAGFLHAILVGDAVASSIIEVSDHASDGDGNVKIYLAGSTLGPALYPLNLVFTTGICADVTNQTHVTFIYR